MIGNALEYLIPASLIVGLSSIAMLGLILRFAVSPLSLPNEAKVFLGLNCREWLGVDIALFTVLLGLMTWHILGCSVEVRPDCVCSVLFRCMVPFAPV
jgi:hypothetical protein